MSLVLYLVYNLHWQGLHMALSTHLCTKNVSYRPPCPELESCVIVLRFKNPPVGKELKTSLYVEPGVTSPLEEAKLMLVAEQAKG